METTRSDYEKQMEKQLDDWADQLKALKAKAEKASADQRKALLADLAELEKLQATGREHFEALEAAAADRWDVVKANVADAWNHVSGAADAIRNRVR